MAALESPCSVASVLRVQRAKQAVVEAACTHRAAHAAWVASEKALDSINVRTHRRRWNRAYDASCDAQDKLDAAEKALFRAVDRLARTKAGR